MKAILSILSCLLVLSQTGCNYSEGFEEILYEDEFKISIPNYMEKTSKLSQDAIVQYANRFRNCYLIILKDGKELSFSDYQKAQIEKLTSNMENPIITDSTTTSIGGNEAIHFSLFGKIDAERIYYEHRTIETATHYFQICSWTRGPERKQRYGEDLDVALNSFKFIK